MHDMRKKANIQKDVQKRAWHANLVYLLPVLNFFIILNECKNTTAYM